MSEQISEYHVITKESPHARIWNCKKLFHSQLTDLPDDKALFRAVYEIYWHPQTKYIFEILWITRLNMVKYNTRYILNIFLVNKEYKLMPGKIKKDLQELLKIIILEKLNIKVKRVDLENYTAE